MTTVWDRGPAWYWMPTLQDQLGRARHLLWENGPPGLAAADEATKALRQASDALTAVLLEFGVETPRGWRLHQLRSRLDAHLLAASALADADAGEAVISVLRRSLEFIGPELEAILPDAAGKSRAFPGCS
ncbi:MAG: hypothetical protein M3083_07650 [Actinomycetota bacterium]|nr:hypothetical protein [Actinomycetota bacterium]MDQ6948002.1 hypothetical protein [Actinomycetota bacterium]